MKTRVLLSFLFAFLLFSPTMVFSQDGERERLVYWKVEMPEGEFMAELGDISAITKFNYIVDNTALVTEVNVATRSSLLARFYHIQVIEPGTPLGVGKSTVNLAKEKIDAAMGRISPETQALIDRKVYKTFPATTHAHTAEFRVSSTDILDKIYDSVQKSWKYMRRKTLKLKEQ